MDSEIWKQRQRVVAMVREAHQILGRRLPWVEIRIAEIESDKVLGFVPCIGSKAIRIRREMADWQDGKLRHVVWHELLHAMGVHHSSGLMAPVYRELPQATMESELKRLMP